MNDETDLEEMEQQIEAVIARMSQYQEPKRANSLTVLASKFRRYEQRCLNLTKTRRVKESNEMVLYEVIQPSDKCFIEGTDFKTVCIATILLGEGKYGLQRADGKHVANSSMPPIFIAKDWFVERFGQKIEEEIKTTDKQALADVLKTVRLECERSSLNDIVGRAEYLVIGLENFIKKGETHG